MDYILPIFLLCFSPRIDKIVCHGGNNKKDKTNDQDVINEDVSKDDQTPSLVLLREWFEKINDPTFKCIQNEQTLPGKY